MSRPCFNSHYFKFLPYFTLLLLFHIVAIILHSCYYFTLYHFRSCLSQYHFRPDGQKKAYVRLAPDYDALDIANKIGII
jgi:hypothetical protein